MELSDRISVIKGIGEKTEKLFNKLNVFTVKDLLEYYPGKYDVYEKAVLISSVDEGKTAAIEASVCRIPDVKTVRNLKIITCSVKDRSGIINLTWFNMPFLKNILKHGTKYIFRGKVIRKNGILVMEQPKLLTKEEFYNRLDVLQPVYPLTLGITSNIISKAVKQIIENIDLKNDYLPAAIRKQYNFMDYKSAIKQIHFPKDNANMLKARKRLVFDEFFFFMIGIRKLKEHKDKEQSRYLLESCTKCEELIKKLPYTLTNAQLKVWNEIKQDLKSRRVMNRLVQGDVGSGKTVLAALALLLTALNGYQGCLMAPTEVLAIQHYESLKKLFEAYDIKVALLVGSMTAKEKKYIYQMIKEHEADIIIGTHTLIQEKVEYDNLALVITDEQHRFGVRQREMLSGKGKNPHILVMSATPIPRTLAIILYGDLDISIVDELPLERLPIKNCVVDTAYRATAYKFIEKEVLEGRQAYIICPMVEESEAIEAENVIEYTEKIKEHFKSKISIEYLHGKMKSKEKNDIMGRFSKNEISILVSTTVVEVGVNVPNASVMMIENAERFGLAQLHQLRGRVGRGCHQSYCILVSGNQSRETKERLEILNKSNDGFFIANEDLKLRGPGDLFGIRQSGLLEFKIADIYNDAATLKDANDIVKNFTEKELTSMCEKNILLQEKIERYAGNAML